MQGYTLIDRYHNIHLVFSVSKSDPRLIKEIIDAVTIPVMAKVRIGHFVEAQVCCVYATSLLAIQIRIRPFLDSPSHRR